MQAIDELRSVMSRLRDPQEGCAWDIKQTFESIAPYTIEEAYEVVDAIERGDLNDLKDELGDLLLQVVFHAQMAEEQAVFNFDDVANAIVDKMVRRHPHVFAETKFESTDDLKQAWEAQKAQERAVKHQDDQPVSNLDGIALALPATKRAMKLQQRAARVGFDWTESHFIYDKIDEEINEVKNAVESEGQAAIEDELGDVLFTVINLARHLQVDPELALKRANAKFEKRFREVEKLAKEQGSTLSSLELSELDHLWNQAKDKSAS